MLDKYCWSESKVWWRSRVYCLSCCRELLFLWSVLLMCRDMKACSM